MLNKIDLTSEEEALEKAMHLDILNNRRYVMISSKTGYNFEYLKEIINNMIFDKTKVKVNNEEKKFTNSGHIEINERNSMNVDRQLNGNSGCYST